MWNDYELDDTAPERGCSWPISYLCEPPTTQDDDITSWSEQMAVEILWAASGRQFGLCTSTYRPCARHCEGPVGVPDAWGIIGVRSLLTWDPWGGSIFASIRCGCANERCSCTRLEALDLWDTPVRAVTNVTIDGSTLDPTAYRLSKNRLLRVDGASWPLCQDWTVDADQVGAWTVTTVHGRPAPLGGRVSAGILASELAKAVCNDESCELPRRVRTLSRAGVSIGFVDPMQFLDQGKTGLYEVDLWLQSVNPGKASRRARVYRVDDPRRASRSRAR